MWLILGLLAVLAIVILCTALGMLYAETEAQRPTPRVRRR